LIDLLDLDHLDVCGNPICPAEIQHLLRLPYPADRRAGHRLRRFDNRLNAATDSGFSGTPTNVNAPSRFSKLKYALMSCSPDTASRMKWKLAACFCISSALFEITTSSAPSRRASAVLFGDVVNSTTCAPSACANFTPICPSPPSPTIPTFCPFPTFHCRIGEYVVIPAHNSGAAPPGSNPF